MYQRTLQGCLAIALTLGIQSGSSAQSIYTETKTTTAGPPVVLDSYMTPAVVRTRETTDSDGNKQQTVEPLILERHERVMLPATETTSTDVTRTGSTVTTETRQLAQKSFTTRSSSSKISHHRRHHYTAQHRHTSVAQRVSTRTVQPTTIEHQESTVERSTVIERRDPALDLR